MARSGRTSRDQHWVGLDCHQHLPIKPERPEVARKRTARHARHRAESAYTCSVELSVGGIQNLADGPHIYMSGYLRNIGRFVARDIELTPFLEQKQGRVMNRPQQTLFPDAVEEWFDCHVGGAAATAFDPRVD